MPIIIGVDKIINKNGTWFPAELHPSVLHRSMESSFNPSSIWQPLVIFTLPLPRVEATNFLFLVQCNDQKKTPKKPLNQS